MRQSIGGFALVGPASDLRTFPFCWRSHCNRCASVAAESNNCNIRRQNKGNYHRGQRDPLSAKYTFLITYSAAANNQRTTFVRKNFFELQPFFWVLCPTRTPAES